MFDLGFSAMHACNALYINALYLHALGTSLAASQPRVLEMQHLSTRVNSADLDIQDFGAEEEPAAAGADERGAAENPMAAELRPPAAGVVFEVFPEVMAIGRMPSLVYRFLQLTLMVAMIGHLVAFPFICGAFAGYDGPSALIYFGCAMAASGMPALLVPMASLRAATSTVGVLSDLGAGTKLVRPEAVASVRKWRQHIFGSALTQIGFGVISAVVLCLPLCSDEVLEAAIGATPGRAVMYYIATFWGHPGGCYIIGVVVFYGWWLSMKSAAALATVDVEHVMATAKELVPAADRDVWEERVTVPALRLHGLMGALSRTWGPAVGAFTWYNWASAIGIFAFNLDPQFSPHMDKDQGLPAGTWHVVFTAVFLNLAFLPLGVALDLARVSSLCDDLMEILNDKSVEDIKNEPVVMPLIRTLKNLNGGQGLG
jgi:hypothetical protein